MGFFNYNSDNSLLSTSNNKTPLMAREFLICYHVSSTRAVPLVVAGSL